MAITAETTVLLLGFVVLLCACTRPCLGALLPKFVVRKVLHMGTGALCLIAGDMGNLLLIRTTAVVISGLLCGNSIPTFVMHKDDMKKQRVPIDIGMVTFVFVTAC